MNTNAYRHYFRNHYKASFTPRDVGHYRRWFRAQWNFISRHVQLKAGDRVLEIGSGFGGFYSFLPGNIVYQGIELDHEAVRFARRHFNKGEFLSLPVEKYTTQDVFAHIFSFEVLEHLENPYEVIRKIHGMLAPHGEFIGTTPYPYRKNVYADSTHRYVLHPSNWEKLFMENGFRTVSLYPFTYPPFLWRIHPMLNFRIPWFTGIPGVVSTCMIIARK